MRVLNINNFVILLKLTLLLFVCLAYSTPINNLYTVNKRVFKGRAELLSERSDQVTSSDDCSHSYCHGSPPPTALQSHRPRKDRSLVSSLSIRGPSSLSLHSREFSIHKVSGFAITWLYTTFIYPVQDAAAKLADIYIRYLEKIDDFRTRTPPLASFTLHVGESDLVFECPNPIAWDTVVEILYTLQLMAESGWAILYRLFIPAFKLWITFLVHRDLALGGGHGT